MKSILEVGGPLEILNTIVGGPVAAANAVGNITDKFFGPRSTKSTPYLGGSISNYANNLIMTFPMLIDNTISPEICSMLSRASERNIVTMLHLLFSSAQFQSTDGVDVIRSIYGKVKPNMSLDDYIDVVDRYVGEATNYGPGYISHDKEINRLISETVKAINECVTEGKFTFLEDSINEKSLLEYTVTRDRNDEVVVKEAPVPNPSPINSPVKPDEHGFYDVQPFGTLDADGIRLANDLAYKRWQMNQATNKSKAEDDTVDYDAQMKAISRRILDTDVKKANELQPTLLIVNYNELGPGPEGKSVVIGKRAFVCGVKSRLIPVESNDIIDRIVSKNKTRMSFLNFVRATTGEIKFIKDFLLSLDQAKIDAKNSVKKGEAAQLWKALEVMSTRNGINKIRKSGNDASAITTLVINKETANYINKQFKIDIEQPRVAKSLFEAFNLLAIFIVDESVEVVKSIYRGNSMYEQQAFSYLEKEENDKSYKKVINLIGQMNR